MSSFHKLKDGMNDLPPLEYSEQVPDVQSKKKRKVLMSKNIVE